jgi:PAS domain S-box-containing protein/putative nucleotidyltransferase with HDIG domain
LTPPFTGGYDAGQGAAAVHVFPGGSSMTKKKLKVLIVDDNSANLYLLETLLKGHGMEVTSAKNGQEALESASLDPPDIVVSDILMPVMDGYTLCRQWKSDARFKQIPFVFYTATYTEPKDEAFALSLGAERFLIKPQEPDELMKVLEEILAGKKAGRPAATMPLGEEMEFVRRHDETVFRKLEKKMQDLEIANQKLRIMEENYRLSFENITDVICLTDADLKIAGISPSVEKLLGYKPQEFLGRPVSDLSLVIAPESFEQAMDDIASIFKGETISARIYRFIAKDGTALYGEVSGSPVIREGRVIRVISVARDISDRKRAEEKVRESEKKYRELYDFLPIPVYEMDLESNLTSANRAIYETFGGTEGDLEKGFKAWQLLSPEEIEKSRENIQKLLRGEKVEGTEYSLKRLDGSVFPAIVISSVIRSHGQPVGLRGAIVDITARRQAEGKLQQMLDRLNKAVSATVQVMASAVEVRDPYTSGHQVRTADLARAISREMRLSPDQRDAVRMAASIHDIGKLSVPAEILSKPTKLTDIEFALIKEHSQRGFEILKNVESPWPLAEIVYQHHERMDGSGYPRNLKGKDILVEARILAVADVVEAMASHRPYRASLGIEEALKEIESHRGILYDPDVVEACLKLFREQDYHLSLDAVSESEPAK